MLITGSAGDRKTYMANALYTTALPQHRTVKYIRADTLLQENEKACLTGHVYYYVNQMAAFNLLVIDDFGLMKLNMDKYRDLFEIIETRDCKKTTMIFLLPVIKCWDLFKDNTYVDACLSRMTSKAYRLEGNGRDIRKS